MAARHGVGGSDMALTRPEPAEPPPQWRAAHDSSTLRGRLAVTASMETLQVGYLHAVAAAAGCSLASPFPDDGIDWHVSHGSSAHLADDEATIKVQLKCTHQIAPNPPGSHFSFTLDNDHLRRLARSRVAVHRILVVMLVPREPAEWISARPDRTELRHCCYWVNLAGHPVTGRRRTNVRIPTEQVFDDRALCAIMARVGAGERP